MARALALASGLGGLYSTWIVTVNHSHEDLEVYLRGARNLFNGRLYAASLPGAPHLPFTYPPFAALFFTPLTFLSVHAAYFVWAAVNVGLLAGLINLSVRLLRPSLSTRARWVVSLLALTPFFWFEPIRANFYFGQINLLLAILVVVDLMTTVRVRGRALPRGVLVGVAAALKLIPLVFVAYLVVTRQARAAATAVVSFIACGVLAALCNPGVSWTYWTTYAFDARRVGGVTYVSNQSLRAALDRFSHHLVFVPLVDAAAVATLFVGAVLTAWAWRRSSTFLALLVTAATGLLVSPITWTHHLVWLVPALLWLVLGDDRPRFGWLFALGASAVFWDGLVWYPQHGAHNFNSSLEMKEHGLVELWANSYFLLVVLFLLSVAVMIGLRGRSSPKAGWADDKVHP